jgi:hypothetical protein
MKSKAEAMPESKKMSSISSSSNVPVLSRLVKDASIQNLANQYEEIEDVSLEKGLHN